MSWGKTSRLFLLIFTMVSVFWGSPSVSYVNEYQTKIIFDSNILFFDTEIVSVEGTLFVPLQDISEELGLEITYKDNKHVFEVLRQADRLQAIFKLNSNKVVLNGDEDELSAPVYTFKSRPYVSLPDFVWVFGYFLHKQNEETFLIASLLENIRWHNQKLIVSAKTPLSAQVEYSDGQYRIIIPNALYGKKAQISPISVQDGVVENVRISNLSLIRGEVLVQIDVTEEIPYVVLPNEKNVQISFIYQPKEKKLVAPVAKKDALKRDYFVEKISEGRKESSLPVVDISVEKQDFVRQGNSFLIKFPLTPDNIVTMENPKRLSIEFKDTKIKTTRFSGREYLPLIKEVEMTCSKTDPFVSRVVVSVSTEYQGFKQFGKNLKLYAHKPNVSVPQKIAEAPVSKKTLVEDSLVPSNPPIYEVGIEKNSFAPKESMKKEKEELIEKGAGTDAAVKIISKDSVEMVKLDPIPEEPVKGKNKKTPFTGKELRGVRVVVDAGHGGRDPGAISRSGLYEKIPALAISKKIAEKVKAAGGVPIMIRKKDEYISLEDRANIAIKKKGDVLISVHLNSFFKQKVYGAEAFYFKPKDFALAKAVHGEIASMKKVKNNGLKQGQMYILNHTPMPGVLIEPAFLSNLKEEKMIKDVNFQEELAVAVVKGIIKYQQNK